MEQKPIYHGPVYDRLPPLSENYQWLIAQSPEEADEDQFFYNIDDPLSYYRCRIPELLGKRIRGSFHGWLILSNDNMWSLWNPVSSKIIRLPPLILKDGESALIKECCLSLPPEDPTSILLLTRTDKPTFVFCRLDRKRKSLRWTEMSYDKQLKRLSGDGCLLHSLSCCNGKVYALSPENCVMPDLVIEIDIVIKAGEVVIELMLIAGCPHSLKHVGFDYMYFLRGSDTELFCIILAFNYGVRTYDATFSCVTLHKVDMSCINWAGLEGLKKWDLTGLKAEEVDQEDANKLYRSMKLWEEMEDLKDANFFVDLARDNSVVYSPAIASAGGKIHIRSRMGKIIYSYNLNDGTILLNSMFPPPVLPTSHVSVWECRLAGDYPKSKQGVEDKDHEIVARSVTDDDVQHKELQLLDLPFGVLDMVMEFCIGVEYLNFRATCKTCHLAAPVLQWRGEAALKRLQNYSLCSPWLMVVDKKRDIVTFEDPLFGYKYFMKGLPCQFDDHARIYSGYGWVLFYNYEYGLEFWNPFTNAVHDLPDVVGVRFSWLCFSAPPTSPDCMVVGFHYEGIYIHHVGGEKSWRFVSLDSNNGDYRFQFYFPTLCGRDLYALDDKGELHVSKNLDQEDISWGEDVVEAPRENCRYPMEYFLTKCDQHLLLIFVDHFGESVEVFKLNDLKNQWEKTDGIGRHMIYISDSTCLCRKAEMSEMENKIFFARLSNKNGNVVFYSLETGMFHTLNAKNVEESFEDFVGTKHYPFSPHGWIEPSWS